MADPIIHPHKPAGSPTWQLVEEGGSSLQRAWNVILSGLTQNEAEARWLTRYYGENPEAFMVALQNLAEVHHGNWKGKVAREMLRTLEGE